MLCQEPVLKNSPVKDKDPKRVLHNTPDHDYVEMAVKEQEGNTEKEETNSPKKVETDVFEFDEMKEGYDKIDLLMKDSKMSYLKSNAQRPSVKKDSEVTNQKIENLANSPGEVMESEKSDPKENEKSLISVKIEQTSPEEEGHTGINKEVASGEPNEIEKLNETDIKSPEKMTETKRNNRNSEDSNEETRNSMEEEKPIKKERDAEEEKLFEGDNGEQSSEPANSDLEEGNKIRRKSEDVGEQSEEEKIETEDADTNKDEEVASNLLEITVS